MEELQHFNITDVFNEVNAPMLIVDESGVLFANEFYNQNYKVDNQVLQSILYELSNRDSLDLTDENKEAFKTKVIKSLQSISGDFQLFEWSFIYLPTKYKSKFLMVKGSPLTENELGFLNSSSYSSVVYSKLRELSGIISNTHDFVVVLDAEGRHKFVSPSVVKKLGRPLSEILGKTFIEVVGEGNFEALKNTFEDVLASNEEVRLDLSLTRRDGSKYYLESIGKNLLDDPNVNGVLFTSRDVTEFVLAEQALKRANQLDHFISQISARIIKTGIDLEEHFHDLLVPFNEFLNTDTSEVYFRNEGRFELFTTVSSKKDTPNPIADDLIINSMTESEKSLLNGEVVLIDRGVQKYLLIPIISTLKFIGVLAIPLQAIDYDLKELQGFNQVGTILASIYERIKLNLKVEKSKELLKSTEILSKSGSWRYCIETNEFILSEGLVKMFGFEEDPHPVDLVALGSKITPTTKFLFDQNLKKILTSKGKESGEVQVNPDPETVLFLEYEIESKVNPTTQCTEIFGVCSDITHKHIAQEELKLQSQILAQVSDPILVTTLDFKILYMNEAALALCNLVEDDFIGIKLCDLIDFKNHEIQFQNEIEFLDVGDAFQKEYFLQINGNEDAPFDLSVKCIELGTQGSYGYSLVLRSLDERYKNEKVSRQAQVIIENSPLIIYSLEAEGDNRITFVSENIKQFGYSPSALKSKSFKDLIHPDDVEKVWSEYRKAMDNDAVYSGEYRIKHTDGSYIWVEDKTRKVYNKSEQAFSHEGFIQDITDRKKLEILNEEKEKQYRILASNIPGASVFLLDKNRRFIIAEGANFDKWGLQPKDFEGKHVNDYSLTDSEVINDLLDKVYNEHQIVETDLEIGGRYYHRVIRPIIEDGNVEFALSIIRDVHVQKKATVNLLASEEKYRALVEESTEIIFSISDKMEVYFVSPNILQHLGYSANEFIGTSILTYLNPEDLDQMNSYMNRANFLNDTQYLEFRIRHKNGNYKIFSSHGRMVAENGVNKYYTGIARDISKLKFAQQELVKAKEHAEQASLAKSQFLSIMSHEIRTPLNAVVGMTHFLINDNPRPDQLESLKTLQFSADNLMGLINDILDYNKIDLKKVELEVVNFDLFELIQKTIHSHSFGANKKGLDLKLDIDKNIPNSIWGDPLRLSQIFNNLLSNSIKFTEKGQVTVKLQLEGKSEDDCSIRFIFEDTGIGIPENKIKTIFDAFTQAHSSTTREFGGTGLGLAIVKNLVELYGSSIELTSHMGQGSKFEFVISFPLYINGVESDRIEISTSRTKSFESACILVAEDNVINQILVKRFLNKWGVKDIILASDGEEALEKFEMHDVDLVLLDVEMPIRDGFYVADKIRNNSNSSKANLPIIVFSASTLDEVKISMESMRVNDYVPKPFSPEVLHGKLTRYLRHK